jgi:imidazolonepropionase-like amidohydrolase
VHRRNSACSRAAWRVVEQLMKIESALLLSVLVSSSLFAQTDRPETRPLALNHVTLIDMTGAQPKPDMTVLVIGNRIEAIGKTGTVRVPAAADSIDASGKYLIPSLWDMHVHLAGYGSGTPEEIFPLFIANGILGIRDMGGLRLDQAREWKLQIEEGTLLGPRIVAAGQMIDGPEPTWPRISIPVNSDITARRAVQSLKDQGADFVKVYSRIPREAYFSIADECRKQRIPFAGHVTIYVELAEASDAGQKSIEHLAGLQMLVPCSEREEEIRKRKNLNASALELVESFSEKKASALFAKFARNGTWQTPTLTVKRVRAYQNDPTLTNDTRLKYVPAKTKAGWDPSKDFRTRNRTAADYETQRKLYQKDFEIIRMMHRAGIQFLAGTDLGNAYLFPGFSLHDELELLVRAGLTPKEALETATGNPAKFLGISATLGTVEKGKLANVVLLEANPLENISNTKRIHAVVVNGRYLPKEKLQKMLAEVEITAANK